MKSILGKIDPEQFMREYWQKKPLLIRDAVPGFASPLSSDEVAGMAMEENIESRLVRTEGSRYSLSTGPFSEEVLSSLPRSLWTLLIQDADKWLPEVAALRQLVDFIPSWRFDDIMISIAADGGSVGPHIDLYDVFLLQAEGERRWQIDSRPNPDTTFDPEQQLRVLQNFSPSEEWELEAGDALYLPPGVPHHGVAIGNCMTWSFGFRAPSFADLGSAILGQLCGEMDREDLFGDPDLQVAQSRGEITRSHLHTLKQALLQKIDTADWSRLLGEALTEGKDHLHPELPEVPYSDLGELSGLFAIDPASRFGFIADEDQSCRLFANGEIIAAEVPRRLCEDLCSSSLVISWPEAEEQELLTTLVGRGHLYKNP